MLCIDLKALRKDPERVQKDVDLVDLINKHTKSFPSRIEARANYAPLNFGVSVRSTYSNTVVSTQGWTNTMYYKCVGNIGDLPYQGEDLIMYVSSLCVLSLCEPSTVLDDIMVKHSVFQPIGLVNTDPDFFDPMIYSHVILTDEGMRLFEKCLKPQNKVCPIKSINPEGNIKPILDTLILIDKEEDNNAEHNHQ